MSKSIAHSSLLFTAAIAFFGAGIHRIAPLLDADWYAFPRATAAAVASAHDGTEFAAAVAVVIGTLVFIWARLAFLQEAICAISLLRDRL
jgi:hypothetical protein